MNPDAPTDRPFPRHRLGRRVAWYILLFSSLVTLLGTSLQLYLDYDYDVRQLHHRFEEIQTSHLPAIVHHTWLTQYDAVQVVLRGIVTLPDMQYARVTLQEGKTLEEGQEVAEAGVIQVYPLITWFHDQALELGTLQVAASLTGIRQRILDRVLVILATQGVKTFLVSFFILILLHVMVGKRLHLLADHARRIRLKHLAQLPSLAYPLSGKNGSLNELDHLALAMGEMVEEVEISYQQIQAFSLSMQKERDRARQYLELVGGLLVEVGRDESLVLINQAGCNLLGYDHELQVMGWNWFDQCVPEPHRSQQRHLFQQQLATPQALSPVESPVLCRDGSVRHILWNRGAVVDEQGQVISLLSHGTDITSLKQTSEALQQELHASLAIQRLSRLLISAEFPTADLARLVLETACNLTASRYGFLSEIHPVTRENIAQARFAEEDALVEQQAQAFLPDGEGHYPGLWGHALNMGRGFFTNDPARHPAARGSKGLQRFLAVPILLDQQPAGEIVLANAAAPYGQTELEFITRLGEIHALAMRQKRAAQEKEHVEKRLNHAQKLEAIGVLAGGVAHDFNNILAIIMGNAEYGQLARGGDPDLGELFNDILQATRRGKELVSQLLTFSRQSADKFVFFQPHPVLKETMRLLRSTIPAQVDIVTRIESFAGTLFGDPVQFQQVLMNLCTNAIHALAQQEQPRLEVVFEAVTVDPLHSLNLDVVAGPYACLMVRDNGVGMPPEIQHRIFDPFFTTKEVGVGTGLGLAMVDGFVRKARGGLSLESQPGQGSMFRIYLPLVRGDHPNGQGQHALATHAGRGRVVFVDDEPQLVKVTTRMLEILGYQAIGFTHGEEALRYCSQHPQAFDLVVTDQSMPGMTGMELGLKIRALRPEVPIYLCSGLAVSGQTGLTQFTGVLHKPLAMGDLDRVLPKFDQ